LSSISIFIISVKNSRNFDNLAESLVQSFGISPTISWGVTPKELPCYETAPHLHEGKYRPLSCREVAAALSHSRAKELAFAEGKEWNIFLEDDSELIRSENSEFIASLLKLPPEIPFFVHLFPEQNGILMSSQYPGMNSIRKIPDYANAYAVNAEGLKLFLKNTDRSHLYLADWPRLSPRIKRIATSRSVFRHPFQSIDSSLISDERNLIQTNSRAFAITYRIKQAVFRIIRIPSAKFGAEYIANENLRSIKWL
jgi:GR25 family glycosyltransferase involved in LPS biosynthesis